MAGLVQLVMLRLLQDCKRNSWLGDLGRCRRAIGGFAHGEVRHFRFSFPTSASSVLRLSKTLDQSNGCRPPRLFARSDLAAIRCATLALVRLPFRPP
jgi:hypothetical protein